MNSLKILSQDLVTNVTTNTKVALRATLFMSIKKLSTLTSKF